MFTWWPVIWSPQIRILSACSEKVSTASCFLALCCNSAQPNYSPEECQRLRTCLHQIWLNLNFLVIHLSDLNLDPCLRLLHPGGIHIRSSFKCLSRHGCLLCCTGWWCSLVQLTGSNLRSNSLTARPSKGVPGSVPWRAAATFTLKKGCDVASTC